MKFVLELPLDEREAIPEEIAEAIKQAISCLRMGNGDLLYLDDVRVDPVDEDDRLEATGYEYPKFADTEPAHHAEIPVGEANELADYDDRPEVWSEFHQCPR